MGCPGCPRLSVRSTGMGYSVEKLQMSVRSKFTVNQNGNQEGLIFPKLACSLSRGNLVRRPLFYADGLRLWVTITMTLDQDVWQRVT